MFSSFISWKSYSESDSNDFVPLFQYWNNCGVDLSHMWNGVSQCILRKLYPLTLPKVRACSVNVKQDWCCPACRPSSHLALIISKVLQYGSQLWERSWDPNLGEPLEGAQQIAVDDDMTLQPQGNIPPVSFLQHGCSVSSNTIWAVGGSLFVQTKFCRNTWDALSGAGKTGWRFLFLAKSCFSFGCYFSHLIIAASNASDSLTAEYL